MPISSATRAGILDLVFLATTWAGYAQNVAASPETNVGFALMTGDPGAAGTMSTNEATYTGYARQNVARTGAGFARTGNSISPAADINYPIGTGGGGTISHFASGSGVAGATPILWSGTVTPNIASGAGIKPILLSTSTIVLT